MLCILSNVFSTLFQETFDSSRKNWIIRWTWAHVWIINGLYFALDEEEWVGSELTFVPVTIHSFDELLVAGFDVLFSLNAGQFLDWIVPHFEWAFCVTFFNFGSGDFKVNACFKEKAFKCQFFNSFDAAGWRNLGLADVNSEEECGRSDLRWSEAQEERVSLHELDVLFGKFLDLNCMFVSSLVDAENSQVPVQ